MILANFLIKTINLTALGSVRLFPFVVNSLNTIK